MNLQFTKKISLPLLLSLIYIYQHSKLSSMKTSARVMALEVTANLGEKEEQRKQQN